MTRTTADGEHAGAAGCALPQGAEFVPAYPEPIADLPERLGLLRSIRHLPTMVTNPIAAFQQRAFTQGVSQSRVLGMDVALVHDPALIRHLFVERPEALTESSVRQLVLKPALRDGLLTATGATWRRGRKLTAPVFAPRHMDGFALAMADCSADFTNDLRARTGERVALSHEMAQLTYAILSRTLFSDDIAADGPQLLADTDLFLQRMGQPDPLDYMRAPAAIPRPTKLRGRTALRRLRAAVTVTGERRLAAIEAGGDVPDDFLTLLLRARADDGSGFSADEIEDNIITFIAAGHETTARALTWALYLLSQDEAWRTACEAEADALDMTAPVQDWAAHLPIITACFEEAMRLFPPAAMIARDAAEDISFDGGAIPRGAGVVVSPWVLHRHAELWDAPHTFRPQRFLGEARDSIGRFDYLPFGMGQRVCIGIRFAMQEAQIALATMLRSLRFTYSDDVPPQPVMKITLQPHNRMPMRVTHRR